MTATKAYKGTGYWISQIAMAAGGGVLFAVLAVFIATSPGEDAGGQSVMVGLASILFFATLVWLIRQFSKQTAEQRAVYAWVIMQRQGGRNPYNVAGDVQSMGLAKKASRGELTREELDQLQALRPDVMYPGKVNPS